MNPPSDPAPPEEEEERSGLLSTQPPAGAPLSPPSDPSTTAPHRSLWPKLRTTLKAASVVGQTTKDKKRQKRLSLTREDSFLKRFSTRHGVCPNRDAPDRPTDARTEANPEADRPYSAKDRAPGRRRFVIRPDENFMFYWLTLNTSAVLYNLWTSIAREAFPEIQDGLEVVWISADVLCDLIYLMDVVVQLRTGYLERGLIVYETGKLARHYVRSWAFLLDVASLVPLDLIQLYTGLHPLVRFPRFLKSYRLHRYIHMMETRTVYPNMWRVVNLTHVLFLGSHWFAAFYFLISKAHDFQSHWGYPRPIGNYSSVAQKYLRSLYWSTLTLTTIGDLSPPESNWEHVFTIVSYLIGVFVFATIVGQVGNVITNRNASRQEFERLLDGAKSYMRNHNVPLDMQRHVQRWYDYAWSRGCMNGGGDINALGLLPDKLKTELALHVHLDTLRKVTIFQECEPEFLHDLVLKMRTYIFTPGDLICRKGEVAREMFIIADGLLEVISERGEILTQMSTGDFFGEIGILNLDGGVNRRTADVRSVGYSELIVLSRDDVLMALKDHPEAEILIKDYGQRRLLELGAHNRKRMSVRLAPSVEGNSVLGHFQQTSRKHPSVPATSDGQPPTRNSIQQTSNRSSRSGPHPTMTGPPNPQHLMNNSADKVDSRKWGVGWRGQGDSGLPRSRTSSDTSGGSGTSDEVPSKGVTGTPDSQTDQNGAKEQQRHTPGWNAGSSKPKDLASKDRHGKRHERDGGSSWKRNLRLENCFRRHRVIVKTDTRDTLLSPDLVEPNHNSGSHSVPASAPASNCDIRAHASLTASSGNVLTGSEVEESTPSQNMHLPPHSSDAIDHTQRGSSNRKHFTRLPGDPVPLIPIPNPRPAPGKPGVSPSIHSHGKLKRISTGKPTRCRSSASVFFDNQVYNSSSSSSSEDGDIDTRRICARGRHSMDLGHDSPNAARDVFGHQWLTKRTDILKNASAVDRHSIHPGEADLLGKGISLVPRAYSCSGRNSVVIGRRTAAPASSIDELEATFGRIPGEVKSSVAFSEPCIPCDALENSRHFFRPLPPITNAAPFGYVVPGDSRNLVNQHLKSSDPPSIANTLTLTESPQLQAGPTGAADSSSTGLPIDCAPVVTEDQSSALDPNVVDDPSINQCLHGFREIRDLEDTIQKTINTFLAKRQALYEDRIRQLEAENSTKTAEIHHLMQALQRSTQVAYFGDNTERY